MMVNGRERMPAGDGVGCGCPCPEAGWESSRVGSLCFIGLEAWLRPKNFGFLSSGLAKFHISFPS